MRCLCRPPFRPLARTISPGIMAMKQETPSLVLYLRSEFLLRATNLNTCSVDGASGPRSSVSLGPKPLVLLIILPFRRVVYSVFNRCEGFV